MTIDELKGFILKSKNKIRETFPYVMFYKVIGGVPIKFDGFVDAKSEAQARFLFRKKYPKVRDIEAIAETWVEIDQDEVKRRTEATQSRNEREQEFIQNAWWNKD